MAQFNHKRAANIWRLVAKARTVLACAHNASRVKKKRKNENTPNLLCRHKGQHDENTNSSACFRRLNLVCIDNSKYPPWPSEKSQIHLRRASFTSAFPFFCGLSPPLTPVGTWHPEGAYEAPFLGSFRRLVSRLSSALSSLSYFDVKDCHHFK